MSNRQLVYIKDDEIIKMVGETLEKQLIPLGDFMIEQLRKNNEPMQETINEICDNTKKILKIVEEILLATKEQSELLNRINDKVAYDNEKHSYIYDLLNKAKESLLKLNTK